MCERVQTVFASEDRPYWCQGQFLAWWVASVPGFSSWLCQSNLSHFYEAAILTSGCTCEAQTETLEKNIPIHQYFSPTWVKQKRVQMTMECFRPIISPVPGAHHPSPASFNPAWVCVYVCVRVFVSVFSNGLLSASLARQEMVYYFQPLCGSWWMWLNCSCSAETKQDMSKS